MTKREHSLVNASRELMFFLGENSGPTDDWPMLLYGRDDETTKQLCEKLNAVDTALRLYGVPTPKGILK